MAVVEYEGGDRLNVPAFTGWTRSSGIARRRGWRPAAAADAQAGRLVLAASAGEDQNAISRWPRAARALCPADVSGGGFAFPPDTSLAARARVAFLYEDTADQRRRPKR